MDGSIVHDGGDISITEIGEGHGAVTNLRPRGAASRTDLRGQDLGVRLRGICKQRHRHAPPEQNAGVSCRKHMTAAVGHDAVLHRHVSERCRPAENRRRSRSLRLPHVWLAIFASPQWQRSMRKVLLRGPGPGSEESETWSKPLRGSFRAHDGGRMKSLISAIAMSCLFLLPATAQEAPWDAGQEGHGCSPSLGYCAVGSDHLELRRDFAADALWSVAIVSMLAPGETLTIVGPAGSTPLVFTPDLWRLEQRPDRAVLLPSPQTDRLMAWLTDWSVESLKLVVSGGAFGHAQRVQPAMLHEGFDWILRRQLGLAHLATKHSPIRTTDFSKPTSSWPVGAILGAVAATCPRRYLPLTRASRRNAEPNTRRLEPRSSG